MSLLVITRDSGEAWAQGVPPQDCGAPAIWGRGGSYQGLSALTLPGLPGGLVEMQLLVKQVRSGAEVRHFSGNTNTAGPLTTLGAGRSYLDLGEELGSRCGGVGGVAEPITSSPAGEAGTCDPGE